MCELDKLVSPEPSATTQRRKLWDLPHFLLCPIIGTCLEVDDLRRILHRNSRENCKILNDYEVHARTVAAAETRNPVSIATQKLLTKRYRNDVRTFARIGNTDELTQSWRQQIARGDIRASLWAIATHAQANQQVHSQLHHEVHMLSHQMGASARADLKRLHQLESETAQKREENLMLQTQLQQHRQQLKTSRREMESLRKENAQLRTQLTDAQDALQTANSSEHQQTIANELDQANHRLGEMVLELDLNRTHLARYRQRIDSLEAQRATLERRLTQQQYQHRTLQAILEEHQPEQCLGCDEEDCRKCPDLGGRRVLCVGGRGALAEHYRSLVQQYNGQFSRHDGGLEESPQRLDALLASADIVICPATDVSHDAYRRTKRYCKRVGKPCLLLSRSGLGAFAEALGSLSH